MAPEWIYLLKVNAGLVLFYAFYKFLCQRDTFFRWRRAALLSFLGISFTYPLLDIRHWVKEQPVMEGLTDYYATWMAPEVEITAAVPQLPNLTTIALYIYLTGLLLLGCRFVIQLLSICRMRYMLSTKSHGRQHSRTGHHSICGKQGRLDYRCNGRPRR